MMKKLFMLLGLAALGLPPCLAADASSLFSPEPPDPGAAALVDAYLPLLAAGQYEQALDMHDMRGMRQYLLDRRLAELKAKNSEMTAQDLEEISAQLQVNDLNPARLQDIMLSVLKEANHAGMTWKLRGYAPAPPRPTASSPASNAAPPMARTAPCSSASAGWATSGKSPPTSSRPWPASSPPFAPCPATPSRAKSFP